MTKQQKKSNPITRRTAQLPIIGILATAGLGLSRTAALAQSRNILPKGLMLNMDFEEAKDGLIPSKSLFPLFVPSSGLDISRVVNRNVLIVEEGQGLTIPHSALLEPDGDEWVVTIRTFIMTDGLIISQGNAEHGYTIFSKESQIYVRVRTGTSAFTLEEKAHRGITKYRKRWVTIEMRISKNRAILSLNRERVCLVQNQPALSGKDLRIRLGDHKELPTVLKNFKGLAPTGFTGAISSLKIHRH